MSPALANLPARNDGHGPMLSRNAEAIFWMSRYIERAEHVARILWVHAGLLIDVGELAPAVQELTWQSVLKTLRVELPPEDPSQPLTARIMSYLTFDPAGPPSLTNCLTRARENARGIRERISSEMWEGLNKLYWAIRSDDARERYREAPESLWQEIMSGSMLFQGLTDNTIPHDERWHFVQAGKYLERIDVTCRVIGERLAMLLPGELALDSPLRNAQWLAVLRCCCTVEAYRQQRTGELDPLQIAAFLLLQEDLPRSVLFAASQAHAATQAIAESTGTAHTAEAQRILGRLEAKLRYAQASELATLGLRNFIDGILVDTAEASAAIYSAYLAHY